jgi:hypothetical protein
MFEELSIVLIALDKNSDLQSNKKNTMIISSRDFPGIRIIAEKNGDESRKSVGLSIDIYSKINFPTVIRLHS